MIESLADAVAAAGDLIRAWARPCAVIGGAAMVLRVRARPTRDIDVVITATRDDLDGLLRVARDLSWEYDDRGYLAEQADAIGVRREIENLLGPLSSG